MNLLENFKKLSDSCPSLLLCSQTGRVYRKSFLMPATAAAEGENFIATLFLEMQVENVNFYSGEIVIKSRVI